jgi:chromate reductase, NAD(P)H dehydrogenase (quinone)
MTKPYDVAVFVGSLRKESFTRKAARALAEIGQPGLALSQIEIGKLGFYNQDLDPDPPSDWKALRDRIRKADAVLFVTPEYNRSVPGVLKNAIDIASRPYGQNAFDGKPGAVVSVSPSTIGGFGANQHLRQSLVFLNVPALQQPEVYLNGADKLFDADGKLQNPQTREFLQGFTRAFENFIERFVPQK